MTSTAKITSSFNDRIRNNQHFIQSQPFNLSTIKINPSKKIDQSLRFLKFNAKYGLYMTISMSSSIQPKASASPNNPSSSWKKWLIGILLTVILPAIGHKGGLWVGLKGKIDKAIGTVEHVTELVEEMAEEAEKIVEEVEEKLPGDSKIKEALESLDDLAKKAVVESKKAEDLIHKVRDAEDQIEVTLIKDAKDQVKK
ncbi:hypothetical protein ACJIZ3_004841 [Penstemon smallii]|uniref:Uncharacterized protein n=1 Tax=Penstemon smallii TaxID=265156 RepID=A0ABD3S3D8_9LAMI